MIEMKGEIVIKGLIVWKILNNHIFSVLRLSNETMYYLIREGT